MNEKLPKRGLKLPYDYEHEHQVYDKDYYENHTKYYERAIPGFTKFLKENFPDCKSIADIGCGTGAFVSQIQDYWDVYGFDFSVGSKATLQINAENFHEVDLTKEFATMPAFGVHIAMSLEVYEHIWPEFEDVYLGNVFGLNSRFVIISCAVPGQIGRRHINCKSKEDVIYKIDSMYPDFYLREDLMEKFANIKYLASFYRHNTLIFENAK